MIGSELNPFEKNEMNGVRKKLKNDQNIISPFSPLSLCIIETFEGKFYAVCNQVPIWNCQGLFEFSSSP